ncbi:MAG TPA: AAA-like domain-containing protein, partial [Anaerolineales bacterium]|nr:AAA-like domain-containing protein [Anaerolineales bacterium]
QSPFNVGQVVELIDFTLGQVSDLNHRHHDPLTNAQLRELYDLLCGHPYLTRRALYLIASQRTTFSEMIKNACEDNGPFGDHLRNHLFRMGNQEKLKAGLVQVLRNHRCSDEHIFFQLRGAGLVKRVANDVIARNPLYADYFNKRLNG